MKINDAVMIALGMSHERAVAKWKVRNLPKFSATPAPGT
jgi:hypothetical protein